MISIPKRLKLIAKNIKILMQIGEKHKKID